MRERVTYRLVSKHKCLPETGILQPQGIRQLLVQPMVQQDQLRLRPPVGPHQHVGCMRIAVHIPGPRIDGHSQRYGGMGRQSKSTMSRQSSSCCGGAPRPDGMRILPKGEDHLIERLRHQLSHLLRLDTTPLHCLLVSNLDACSKRFARGTGLQGTMSTSAIQRA